ncbi:ornithine carbamoyltransferase [Zobellella denitrificans]|jgi:ornithine carbamoyltransferase|uniref:Ornithine carbamoyltransferase n=1 Tax=Zobellella denitrificans TaxID=347534 RepID=A0A231MZN2_9GAMM|nr:ornithine carbamoyltransferase [Zobellella denitrificans]ATG75475.1 ornithine carbamoyltransferase [Zobellella denitrificans]OXS15642.1 ornithine carbamoyltransferase [Zobellella denitrificans]
MQHLLSMKDYSKEQIEQLLALAMEIKANPAKYAEALKGKSVVTLFEKPSLRTRVTFDIGINKLGGHAVYLDSQNGAMGKRETVQDFAANLSRWCDAIVARVFDHQTLVEMTKYATVPVINSLCNLYHPCQALADYMTIAEHHDDLSKVHLAYVGDGNNVTNSLLLTGAILGTTVTAACPRGHNVDAQILKEAEALAAISGAKIRVTDSLDDIEGADVIYTDTWVSMGDNTPLDQVKEIFMPYQVNQALLDKTGAKQVLHCQPAHREWEITSEVMDGPASLILDQAENRMHVQNAVLLTLINRDIH